MDRLDPVSNSGRLPNHAKHNDVETWSRKMGSRIGQPTKRVPFSKDLGTLNLEPWNPEPWNLATLNLGTLNLGTLEPWNLETLEPWNLGTLKP